MSSIQPYVDHVIQVFGTERVIWGSDWPVVELANGLSDWVDVTQQILAQFSESEAEAMGVQNAAKLYDVSAEG